MHPCSVAARLQLRHALWQGSAVRIIETQCLQAQVPSWKRNSIVTVALFTRYADSQLHSRGTGVEERLRESRHCACGQSSHPLRRDDRPDARSSWWESDTVDAGILPLQWEGSLS